VANARFRLLPPSRLCVDRHVQRIRWLVRLLVRLRGRIRILTIVIIGYRKDHCHTQKWLANWSSRSRRKALATDPGTTYKVCRHCHRDPGQAFLARRTTSNAPRSRGRECAMTWWDRWVWPAGGQVAFPATSSPRSFGSFLSAIIHGPRLAALRRLLWKVLGLHACTPN